MAMIGKIIILVLVIILLVVRTMKHIPGEIRYVAIGDSYTIGTSVDPKDSWPEVLTRDLNDHGVKVRLVANPARNGKATNEVISEQLPVFDQSSPDFATLLIGVNDFNRGYSKESFQKNLVAILDHMLAKLPKNRLVVITIPDFSVTPTGKTFGDPVGNSKGIAQFNEIIKTEAAKRNLPVVDVYKLSQQMASDQSLVSSDQLHPSAKEYSLWEKLIFPIAFGLLK